MIQNQKKGEKRKNNCSFFLYCIISCRYHEDIIICILSCFLVFLVLGISKMVHDALSVSVCTTPLRLFANRFCDNMELHLYEAWELHAEILSFKRTNEIRVCQHCVDSCERPFTGGLKVYSLNYHFSFKYCSSRICVLNRRNAAFSSYSLSNSSVIHIHLLCKIR